LRNDDHHHHHGNDRGDYNGGRPKNPFLSSTSRNANNRSDNGNADDGQVGGPILPAPPPVAPPTMLLRPIPRRPTAPTPLSPNKHGGVCHIIDLDERDDEPPSPLTLPSGTLCSPMDYYEEDGYHHHDNDNDDGAFLDHDDEYYSYFSSYNNNNHYVHNNNNARDALLHALACTRGDVSTKEVEQALLPLIQVYNEQMQQMHHHQYDIATAVEGMWLTLSKPTFFGNLGDTPGGDPMYTLGRMSFDMFLPTKLVCSLQANFNPVRRVGDEERDQVLTRCPKSLVDELERGGSVLRTYKYVQH
jgi:hypothetical protein